ncbi:MAG: OmpA family protein [Alphaproteobacteria bacterium]|nr:OmpA family protein [Alphaproteobacteria bacterium]
MSDQKTPKSETLSEEEKSAAEELFAQAKKKAEDEAKELARKASYMFLTKPGSKRGGEISSSLWLITFTDIMALMLTFFVLLFSMSEPSEEAWDEITTGLNSHFAQYQSPQWYEGGQDEIDIEKLDLSEALNLGYLRSVITQVIKDDERLNNVVLIPQEEALIISLPEELLFPGAAAEVSAKGKQALFAIGGSLANIRNRIEIIGHTDPQPFAERPDKQAGVESNWELSLRRAMAVGDILAQVGYKRPVIVRGVSSARYDELDQGFSQQQRLDLSRRVDVWVMKDDGSAKTDILGLK